MPRAKAWEKCTNQELLEWRLCDLGLTLEGSGLEAPIERLYRELEGRKLRLKPHCWISEEWFSPDGVPGIAIPFYLAHPRLKRLERAQILEVEGGTAAECLRLLRHEAGHAIQHAFRLHRRKRWRELFGSTTEPYPDYYRPNPGSRRYVVHLPNWYAQSHPDEDFAETFAVWLTPGSRWRRKYLGWPALRKLRYVDQLMHELAGQKPPVRSKARPDPIHRIKTTLDEHYRAKRQRYRALVGEHPDVHVPIQGGIEKPEEGDRAFAFKGRLHESKRQDTVMTHFRSPLVQCQMTLPRASMASLCPSPASPPAAGAAARSCSTSRPRPAARRAGPRAAPRHIGGAGDHGKGREVTGRQEVGAAERQSQARGDAGARTRPREGT